MDGYQCSEVIVVAIVSFQMSRCVRILPGLAFNHLTVPSVTDTALHLYAKWK